MINDVMKHTDKLLINITSNEGHCKYMQQTQKERVLREN